MVHFIRLFLFSVGVCDSDRFALVAELELLFCLFVTCWLVWWFCLFAFAMICV